MILICTEEEFNEVMIELKLSSNEMYDIFQVISRSDEMNMICQSLYNYSITQLTEVVLTNDNETIEQEMKFTRDLLNKIINLVIN